jgi:hypothetical protein
MEVDDFLEEGKATIANCSIWEVCQGSLSPNRIWLANGIQ